MSASAGDGPGYDLTIREAGAGYRSGTLSPVELTMAVLGRLAATDPVVQAFVLVTAEDALLAAERAADELRTGQVRGPLHGIPIAVKDIVDVAGLPTGCGSRVREGTPAAGEDADVVARLRAAGAVLVGKTVTHEFASGVTSPPTRNPWDPSRIPGGSSGGSAAAVAIGSCLAALGSDTAGSIRIPAALTGVVGLKPTRGLVSNRGVFPVSWSLDTVGPLARTVEDAALVLDAIAGGDGPSAAAELDGGLRGLRLGVPRPYFFDRLQLGVRHAVESALETLDGFGAELIEVSWPEANAAAAAGFVIARAELAEAHAETLRTAPDRYGPVLRSRLEAFSLFPARGYLRARRARVAVGRAMAALFAAHRLDALVTPTVVGTATGAERATVAADDGELPVHAGFTRLTMPFNATGQPALSVPCGFAADGLPIGLQIVGRPFAEATVCRIGHAYQQATGWHLRRPALSGDG